MVTSSSRPLGSPQARLRARNCPSAVRRAALGFGVALTTFAVVMVGCAPQEEPEFPTLANSGILPLSTSNGYVGANLFISREMEESAYLFNFLKGRGAPTAIEIIKSGNAPERVVMFYPATREAYAADVLSRSDRSGRRVRQWIIRGPYPIERNDYRSLAEMTTSLNGEPIFIYQDKPFRFRFDNRSSGGHGAIRPAVPSPIPPTPSPTPTPKPHHRAVSTRAVITAPKATVAATVPTAPAVPTPDFRRPMTSDQVALLMAQGYAERAPDGSVVHTVRATDQTIAIIAAWYTGSADAAKVLAEKNGVHETDPIPLGKRITIPVDLVKNFKALGGKP